jgi:ketosteroid isomerase-like protein
MRSEIALVFRLMATCLLLGSAHPVAARTSSEGRSEINVASRALVAAQLRYDAPAVARLLARDFVYVGNDGSLANRSEFLPKAGDRRRRPLEFLEWTLVRIQFYGDTAVALYSIHEKSTVDGKPNEFRGRSLATWVKQNGRWLCAAIHD